MGWGSEEPDNLDINPSDTILTSIAIYVTLFIVGWIIFEILQHCVYAVFACRKRSETTTCPTVERKYGCFGWVFPVLRTSDDDIFDYCGLDTLYFFRVLRLGEKLALCGICLSFALFPLYATGTNPQESSRDNIDLLERITMSNLSQKEERVWSSVLAMYFMSFFAMYMFMKEYKLYTKRRHEFLGREGIQQYSVVINDLPVNLRTNQTLQLYMEYLFPGQVHSVHVAVDCEGLEKMVEKKLEVRNALEHVTAIYTSTGIRPAHKPTRLIGSPIDSVNFYQEELEQLNRSIETEIKEIETQERELASRLLASGTLDIHDSVERDLAEHGDTIENNHDPELHELEPEAAMSEPSEEVASKLKLKYPMLRSAFVSFTSLKAAQSAKQLLQTADPIEMEVKAAPHPKDIVWDNIGKSRTVRKSSEIISWVITICIILFWTIPTTAVASLASVETLSGTFDWLKELFDNHPWLKSVAKQLSPIGLIVMTELASFIFGLLSKREGHPSLTQVNASHFSKLVYFQTFQIFIVSVIAGTVLNTLEQILNDPKQIISLLGSTLPAQSTNFMSYLIVQLGLKLTLELLRVVPSLKALVYKAGAPSLTERERKSPWLGLNPITEPGGLMQTGLLPIYFLTILLIFAFCAIAPLLCYFAGLFLLMSDVIFRRQVLFVYDPLHFSTGVYWPKLHDCLVGALLLAQLTFLGLVSIKITPGPIFLATILPFFTIAYYFLVNSVWPRAALNLPISICCRLDKARSRRDKSYYLDPKAYIQPAFEEDKPLDQNNTRL